jgi:hypothetical protein
MTIAGYNELDVVVLRRDISDSGLRAGDIGTLVHIHAPNSFEVEFVSAAGRTKALLTLSDRDVRPVSESDVLAVRSVRSP